MDDMQQSYSASTSEGRVPDAAHHNRARLTRAPPLCRGRRSTASCAADQGATDVAYDCIKKLLRIVNTKFGSGKLILVGSIQINLPKPYEDHRFVFFQVLGEGLRPSTSSPSSRRRRQED